MHTSWCDHYRRGEEHRCRPVSVCHKNVVNIGKYVTDRKQQVPVNNQLYIYLCLQTATLRKHSGVRF